MSICCCFYLKIILHLLHHFPLPFSPSNPPPRYPFSNSSYLSSQAQVNRCFVFSYFCYVYFVGMYINRTCWIHFCCLCAYNFRSDHFGLVYQEGSSSLGEDNSPCCSSCWFLAVLYLWMGPDEIFPLSHQHVYWCCHCPSLIYSVLSR